jgi:hypothetical protein
MSELRDKASVPMPLDIVPRFVASRREQRNFQLQSLGHSPNEEATSKLSSFHMRMIKFGVDASTQILLTEDSASAKHFKRSGKHCFAIKPIEGARMNAALDADPFDEPLP